MKKTWKTLLIRILCMTPLASSCAAYEICTDQACSSWMIRVRGVEVVHSVSSSNITVIGGKITHVSSAFVPELDISYFFNSHLAVEVPLGTMRSHVKATGTALGSIDLGEVSFLPPMILFQYHFPLTNTFVPYVGAGPNYTIFYKINPGPVANRVTYTNSTGPVFQLGADFYLNKNWTINADIKKLLVKTYAVGYALGTTVSTNVTLNPTFYGIGIGYHF